MTTLNPSPAQREAIEAPLGAVLVLAGPGAGKTFCLIERIRHLITHYHFDPARLNAFTFTNKAAEEISTRLEELGPSSGLVRRGTLHAFCADLLRKHGSHVGLTRGFLIADEDYQRAVLSRVGVPYKWSRSLLTRFSQHRFQDKALADDDARKFRKYERYLTERNVIDFDMIMLRAAELLDRTDVAPDIQGAYDYFLVDEFQDLNPVQFEVIRKLVVPHGNVFAVGDDEQSIYSWAGADPRVFVSFTNTFSVSHRVVLSDNRRCPRQVVDVARRLMRANGSLFDEPRTVTSTKDSPFEVEVHHFTDDVAEAAWVLEDVRRVVAHEGVRWGDIAVLFRTNGMGSTLEADCLRSGVPCRMAQGRALADDAAVAYLIAALRVIAQPGDPVREAEFLRGVLPRALFAEALTRAESRDNDILVQLDQIARERPKGDEDARKIRRGQHELQNLTALAGRHERLSVLVQELLSQRVGEYRSLLEDRHDELTDPAGHPEVVALAERLLAAKAAQRPIAFAPMGGLEIPLRAMVAGAGLRGLLLDRRHPDGPLLIGPSDVPGIGIALGLFKALQYLATRDFTDVFRDFTTFDIEATGRDVARAAIIEVAAVRVRAGAIVDTFTALANPGVPIPAASTAVHHITNEMVAGEPGFGEVWPALRDFLGRDVIVAHNGHGYDFPLLKRSVAAVGETLRLTPYDSLPLARELHAGSRSLKELAHAFGIDAGASHRALDDSTTLALVFLRLNELKLARARKTALANIMDHLGIALALTPDRCDEAVRFFEVCRLASFSRFSRCLADYEAERARLADPGAATVDRLIEALGGAGLMARIQATKDADDRYPETMARLRRLLDDVAGDKTLGEQIQGFLETIVLSRFDGTETDRDRVNLLTLHATKGLEFKRVYIVGVSDDDLVTANPERRTKQEVDEARRLLYVGMTRTQERLVLTWCDDRDGKARVERRFLAEMDMG